MMIYYSIPIIAALALLLALYFYRSVVKEDMGTEKMKDIAGAISAGAHAFLHSEYRVLLIFVIVLFFCIGIGVNNFITAISFVAGACLSVLAGYFGMNTATKANVRCANAARRYASNKALEIAFSGGSVMGLCVAGFGILGVCIVYAITKDVHILSGFSLGASSIALFARVGGGIYTKAADVGADLVGKVEAGINEGFSEVKPLGIRMEYISRATFLKMLGHVFKCR